MSEEITSCEVQQTDAHTDAGDTYEIRCPNCQDRVFWAESMWSKENICECGYEWRVEIKAIGDKC